ncbi:hypothetical protein NLJ89_g6139 [Agrocybe chaxingu]|uniref:Origin recognition complex subunit 5 n=1 Tax=Agrocybe chaxingu TaxID=84603 RepID=A0A9W8MUC4_9AGAR|nr:hypothetical protein NLJ89_g6139 [Agrocybe chaxingu]
MFPVPGYEQFCNDLSTLLSTYPPSFIYVQDIESIRTTFGVIDAVLQDVSGATPLESTFKVHYVRVDTISCFTTRLFFETVINTLVGWEPKWEDGCTNWSPENELKWNENLDTFLHGLRAAHQHLCQQHGIGTTDKGKGKQRESSYEDVRFVIVVERAERLKENLPELIVPLTRLAEMARIDLTVIFVSQVGWEHIRPPLGASPDPYFMDIQGISKDNIAKSLISNFSSLSISEDILNNPYHPALASLYTHFIITLCDICFPFTHDPQELQYIAAARWPGFVKPVIDAYSQQLDERMDEDGLEFTPPSEEVRVRLIRYFNPTFTSALEALLPRLTNATDWAKANEPPPNLLSLPRTSSAITSSTSKADSSSIRALPRMSKFILVASFLASTNPPKSDLRMFGRGLDEKKRRRRATAKTSGKTKSGAASKIPQRLLGPAAFALDRMIAILGGLLEENDVDTRMGGLAKEFKIPGEYTDTEIGRVGVYSTVMELASMGLLHRTSPPDRLDGPPMFKCAVSYETTLLLAKELDVALNDLLWDPM